MAGNVSSLLCSHKNTLIILSPSFLPPVCTGSGRDRTNFSPRGVLEPTPPPPPLLKFWIRPFSFSLCTETLDGSRINYFILQLATPRPMSTWLSANPPPSFMQTSTRYASTPDDIENARKSSVPEKNNERHSVVHYWNSGTTGVD